MSDNGKKTGRRSLVICLVCGEIFDSSLDTCPVCGVGPDLFEPYEEAEVSFMNNTDERFVILGNGAAGISAARAIRERNDTCSITMITDEPTISYNRPMLTKILSTLEDVNNIAIHNKNWYDDNRITNLLDTKILSLDTEKKEVHLEGGQVIPYDKCIYALGAECFIPPIAGYDKPEVIAIRKMEDVKKIHEKMGNVKNTVVIGGGVLGLEAAWEMSKSSNVTVLEVADKLMGRQLDDEAGIFLGELIQEVGIGFRVNAKIVEITGQDHVTAVKLDDGTEYLADLVIISCGIQSNIQIGKEAGLKVDRSIIVNERMETNITDLYACGDCAQYEGVNYAIWPQALEMGKVAGANAAGESLIYEIVPAALTFEGMNTSLYAAGDTGKNPSLTYTVQGTRDDKKKTYEKYYYANDKLVGAILIGDISKIGKITERLSL